MGELSRERLEATEELQLAVHQKRNGNQKSSQMKVLLSPFLRFPDQSSCGRVEMKSAIEATVRTWVCLYLFDALSSFPFCNFEDDVAS